MLCQVLAELPDGGFKTDLEFRDVIDAFHVCHGLNKKLKEKTGKILTEFGKLVGITEDGVIDDQEWLYELETLRDIGKKDWKKIAKPSAVQYKDPASLFKTKKQKEPAGYLLSEKPEDWHKFLEPAGKTGFEHVVGQYFEHALAPGITINGHLYDGYHRCRLAYGLDIKMPVVDFKI